MYNDIFQCLTINANDISIMSKSFNSFLQFECYIPHSKIFIITSVIHRMMFRVFKSFNEIKSFRGVTMCMNRLKILQDISCCNNSHYIFLTHPHQPHAYDNILYPSCTKTHLEFHKHPRKITICVKIYKF